METEKEKTPQDTSSKGLRIRRDELAEKRDRLQPLYYSLLVLAIFGPLIAVWAAWRIYRLDIYSPTWVAIIIYSLMPLAMLPNVRIRLKQLDDDMQEIEFRIDLQELDVSNRERRAEKILRLNDFQLHRYYNLNIRHNYWVFCLGIFCILIGIGIISITLFLVTHVAQTLETRIIIAALGSVGAILTNFIAAIYLKMNTAATENLAAFHSRLVETHRLLLGNLLASRIEDDNRRWETLSQLSLRLIEKTKD